MSRKINSLQLLRFIAVTLVVLVHTTVLGASQLSQTNAVSSFFHLDTWGVLGVDLFFAISGFIMTIVTPSYVNNGGAKEFLIKRMVRIVPLYYLITLFSVCLAVFRNEQLSFALLFKSFAFFPIFDGNLFIVPIVGVGWSLSYEMYFYLLISILLILKRSINLRLIFILILLSIIGLVLNPSSALLKFVTSPMLLEFAFGITCGILYKKFVAKKFNTQKLLSISLLIIGLGLMSISIFIYPEYKGLFIGEQSTFENDNYAALFRVIILGFPCALFLLGVVFCEHIFETKIPNIFVSLGDASYSCYLIHSNIYGILLIVFFKLSLNVNLYIIATVPICLFASLIFYRLIEKPITIGIDNALKLKKPKVMS